MFDHYSAAKKIAESLNQEGYESVAIQITDDLEGFSGTEIFMALRFHLDKFLVSKADCSANLKESISELLAELARGLAS